MLRDLFIRRLLRGTTTTELEAGHSFTLEVFGDEFIFDFPLFLNPIRFGICDGRRREDGDVHVHLGLLLAERRSGSEAHVTEGSFASGLSLDA